jgi:hypothetical protein
MTATFSPVGHRDAWERPHHLGSSSTDMRTGLHTTMIPKSGIVSLNGHLAVV